MRSAPSVFGLSRADLELIGILGVLVAVAIIPVWIGLATWFDHLSLRTEWKIAGPPCPATTRAWPIGKIKPKVFRYKGVQFERRYGAVYCEAVPDEGLFNQKTHAVCQFSGPGQLIVAAPRGVSRWEPGVGRRATVTIRDGRAACVVGGWFGY